LHEAAPMTKLLQFKNAPLRRLVPDLLLEKINLEEAAQLNGDRPPEHKVAEHVRLASS
jgi:hypothetical protein